jgi:cytochrome c-type biogenesis protein CcmH/NrfG/ribosomal protein L40E
MSESEQAQGTYCQNCMTWNPGDRDVCRKCGTRLLIVTGDHGWDYDVEESPGAETEEDLEEHLLERITGLEESSKRIETYLETVSDQLGKLERSEVMLRNGLMSLVQELEQKNLLDAQAFSQRWEMAVEDNLHLLSARELFTRYRARILPIAKSKAVSQLRRALLETTALLDNMQLTEAAQRLEDALPIDPKNYELLFAVAALMEIIGEPEKASHLAYKVIHLSPRHYEAWMLIAKIAQVHIQQPDSAIEALRTAAELRPEELEPKMALTELLLGEDDLQGAFDSITSALEIERNGDTLRTMGEVLIARGDYAKAIPLLKEASEHQPGEISIRALLAEGYIHASEHQKAFSIVRDLLRLYPSDPDLLILLDSWTPEELSSARGGSRRSQICLDDAEEWLKENNLAEARKCLQDAKSFSKSDRADWIDLQIIAAGNITDAAPELLTFSTSQRHPRLCFNALRLAVDYLMTLDDKTAVMQALDNYISKYPKTSGAWECAIIRQAFLLMAGKASENDLIEVKRLQANPLPGQESNATTLLGQYLLDFHQPQEVIDLIVPRIEHEPTLINHFQLGSALAATGRKTRALEILRAGKNADSSNLNDGQAYALHERLDALIQDLANAT